MAHDAWDTYLAAPFAPTPAGLAPRMGVYELPVAPIVPVQHSPETGFHPGVPLPGPPSVSTHFIDFDSIRLWAKGSGQTLWSAESGTIDPNVRPAIPESMLQHIDVWHYFSGGYPSLSRNRPPAFGDQVATLNPNLS